MPTAGVSVHAVNEKPAPVRGEAQRPVSTQGDGRPAATLSNLVCDKAVWTKTWVVPDARPVPRRVRSDEQLVGQGRMCRQLHERDQATIGPVAICPVARRAPQRVSQPLHLQQASPQHKIAAASSPPPDMRIVRLDEGKTPHCPATPPIRPCAAAICGLSAPRSPSHSTPSPCETIVLSPSGDQTGKPSRGSSAHAPRSHSARFR